MHRIGTSWLLTCLLVCTQAFSSAQEPSLQELFRAEIALVAPKLRIRQADLDPDVALALASSGTTSRPSVGGYSLFAGDTKHLVYSPLQTRIRGYRAALQLADKRAAFSFALSLVLEPDSPAETIWSTAYEVVAAYGDGFDRVLVGILSAPTSMPLLPKLAYPAADVLVMRADPKHIPLFLALAQSRDVYLRSRGIAGLGLVSCTESAALAGHIEGLLAPIRTCSVSATQRAMFSELFEKAAKDRSYRVRGAAALALGLAGDDESRSLLVRLARDPAYIIMEGQSRGSRRVVYPVRATAETVLARLGYPVTRSGGEFADRDLRKATRGGRDVTRDTRGTARGMISRVLFNPWGW